MLLKKQAPTESNPLELVDIDKPQPGEECGPEFSEEAAAG